MTRRILMIAAALTGALALTAVVVWTTCRIYVAHDECVVLISKWGDPLPPGEVVSTQPGQQGIQEDVLGPGRYFYNPVFWDWKPHKLCTISSGNPETWEWIASFSHEQREQIRQGTFEFKGEFPKIGVVVRKVGPVPPGGQVIVSRDSGYRGILAEVLTPGTYRLNPYVYEVEEHPATVIPAGFVGVVTNLFGRDQSPASRPEDAAAKAAAELNDAAPASAEEDSTGAESLDPADVAVEAPDTFGSERPALARPGERGTLRDVLQPGVYFINPKLQKVTLIEIGYNEFSHLQSTHDTDDITFPSDTGFMIRVSVTVVWGIHPQHAAEIINEFGNVDRVLDKVIHPQLRSICRNIGSNYAARDFIQGEKREKFQEALTEELQRVCRSKNIEVVIALVHDIEVQAQASGDAVSEDLKRTIQESYIAIEKQLTKEKQREAAMVRAQLEEERKKIDIARETVRAQTRVKVETILAEGEKEAARIKAQGDLEVAQVQEQVAQLDAQRTRILGQAEADVEKLKKQAEADGYRLLIEAFGSPRAYNLYTFAENFRPESIRLFFAGDGTFWTDLSRFEEVGAARVLQPKTTAAGD